VRNHLIALLELWITPRWEGTTSGKRSHPSQTGPDRPASDLGQSNEYHTSISWGLWGVCCWQVWLRVVVLVL